MCRDMDQTTGNDFLVSDSASFRHWQQTFDFEMVNYAFQSGNVSRSLYYSMQMLPFYPGNTYLIANIGRCFNKLYEAQKQHELGKIAELPSPYQEKKYNDFLQFLQRLRLGDIAAINYHFLSAYESHCTSDKMFDEVL